MNVFALLCFSAVLGYAAFQKGGVWPQDWYPCLLAIGAMGLLYWGAARRWDLAPRLGRRSRVALLAAPAVFGLQLVPLPPAVVAILSPARAELARTAAAADGSAGWIPLSAVPASTAALVLSAVGCLVALLLARELAWRWSERPWVAALPLVVLGVLEALLGVAQAYAEGGDGIARGTYVNRNHFAGLLEMCLPFPVAWGLWLLRRRRGERTLGAGPVLRACLLFAGAALLLVAIIHSGSRMGFIAALFCLTLMGTLAWTSRARAVWKRAAAPALLALAAVAFVQLPTDALIAHFAELAAPQEISSDTRTEIWRETLPAVAAYPVLGCGLGGYESVMARYKSVAPLSTLDFAHNDYLQLLVEGGALGLAAGLALAALLVSRAVYRLERGLDRQRAMFALACLGSLAAILLHSLVDFNLHIPANALVAAWVGGMAIAPE